MDFNYYEIIKYTLPAITVIIVLIIKIFSDKGRTKKIRELAMNIGFYFEEDKKPELPTSTMMMLRPGYTTNVFNLMRGRRSGYEWNIFDFSYTSSSGGRSNRFIQTMYLVKLKNKVLPSFLLTPEKISHKISKVFGSDDIDFENHPEFSDKYYVKGTYEEGIRKIFDAKVIHFFEQRSPDYTIEAGHEYLLFFKQNKKTKVDDIIEEMNKYAEAAKLFDMDKSF